MAKGEKVNYNRRGGDEGEREKGRGARARVCVGVFVFDCRFFMVYDTCIYG